MVRATAAALALLALASCGDEPRGPGSPDPVRFVLDGEPAPCRIVFGPLAADLFFQVHEVAAVDTPDGPTRIAAGVFFGDDADGPDFEIDRIDVHLDSADGRSSIAWTLPPREIVVSTASLGEDELRDLAPELVREDVRGLATLLAERIDGGDVVYAGPAARYDVGLTYDDGRLSVNGRGIEDDAVDATYGLLPDDALRARDATLVVESDGDRQQVDADTFAELVEDLLGDDSQPRVRAELASSTVAHDSCDPGAADADAQPADVTDVDVVVADVGALLRVTFAELPPDDADPVLVHVLVGDVELVGFHDGTTTVEIAATFTHAEAALLADALAP